MRIKAVIRILTGGIRYTKESVYLLAITIINHKTQATLAHITNKNVLRSSLIRYRQTVNIHTTMQRNVHSMISLRIHLILKSQYSFF